MQAEIEGLIDEYRAGRPRAASDAQVAEIIYGFICARAVSDEYNAS